MHVRLLLLSISCWVASAQAPVPEVSTHEAPAVFRTGTDLVLVPVVIRDLQGNAVGNLTKDDFQLFDKGKPQTILKFSVERPGSGTLPTITATNTTSNDSGEPAAPARPVAIPERFVAIIFDDQHLLPGDFLAARVAADRQLTEIMKEPGTRVSISTTSGHQALDFTDDFEKAHKTLVSIIPQQNGLVKDERCPDINYYWADLILNRSDDAAIAVSILETQACLPGIDGESAKSLAHGSAIVALELGRRESRLALSVVDGVVRRMSANPGKRSVVFVSGGFYLDLELRAEQMDIFYRAIKSGIVVNTLDARGLYAVVPGGSVASQGDHPGAGTPPPTPTPNSPLPTQVDPYVFAQRLQIETAMLETNVMAEFATATGGRFFHNDNRLQEGFGQLAAQPEYLYVLGFSPQNMKMDGSRHALKVTLKNGKGLDVQARRDYYAPDHKADAAEQSQEDIRSAVFSRDELQEIPVEVSLQFFKSSDVNAKLTVVTKVDLKTLHFRKDEDRNDETLTLVSSVFDRNGNFVTGTQRVIDMRLKSQTLDTLLTQGITVKTTHDLTPGSYLVRLVVRDSEGQTMAARNGAVEIP
jgi:VWFA-related protein